MIAKTNKTHCEKFVMALSSVLVGAFALTSISSLAIDVKPVGEEVSLVSATKVEMLPRMDLDGFYERALEKSARSRESAGQLKVSEARQQLAGALRLPTLSAEVISGPSPTITGDALNSSTSYDSWGIAFQSKVELIQPIYTFGAIGSLREAARAAHEAEAGRHAREKWQLRQDIAKLYFGYQLAFELRELTRELQDQLEKAQSEGKKLRRRKAKGAPSLTDLERLKVYIAELTSRFDEAQKFMDLAKLGMALEVESTSDALRWRRANLKRLETEFKDLDYYVEISKSKRPEYKALQKEIEAKELFVDAMKAGQLPQIFAGARWTTAYSNVSDKQTSVYANDSFNQDSFVGGVGLRWNLFSPTHNAKIAAAKAELIKTRAKNGALLTALSSETQKDWLELRFLRNSLEQRLIAEQSSKRVFLDMFAGFTIGTQRAKDLLEAMALWAQMKKARLETLHQERLAWVRLEGSTGQLAE